MPRQKKQKKVETDEVFEFEKILDHRYERDGTLEFFVKWKNYPSSENTWEAYSSFDPSAVQDYLDAEEVELSKEANSANTVDAEEIIDIIPGAKDKQLLCLVKCKSPDNIQEIPAKVMNILCPQLVIEFYERNISWK